MSHGGIFLNKRNQTIDDETKTINIVTNLSELSSLMKSSRGHKMDSRILLSYAISSETKNYLDGDILIVVSYHHTQREFVGWK